MTDRRIVPFVLRRDDLPIVQPFRNGRRAPRRHAVPRSVGPRALTVRPVVLLSDPAFSIVTFWLFVLVRQREHARSHVVLRARLARAAPVSAPGTGLVFGLSDTSCACGST